MESAAYLGLGFLMGATAMGVCLHLTMERCRKTMKAASEALDDSKKQILDDREVIAQQARLITLQRELLDAKEQSMREVIAHRNELADKLRT